MKFFTLAKASEMSHNEIVFLSDVSGDDRIFSVEGLPPFSLGEVLEIRKKTGGLRLEIKDEAGIYEVAASPWHKFAIYMPDTIAAKNLTVGDKVLLRGENAHPDFINRDSRASCVSEVLKISQNRKSELDILVKLSCSITPKLYFGPVELPFHGRPTAEVLMTFSPDAKIEISHGGYA